MEIIFDLISPFRNLDLLVLGIAGAAIVVLGMIVFLSNPRSITRQTFLAFALLTVGYGIVNYLSYQVVNPIATLWLIRFTIFFAIWHAFSFFQLFYVFPKENLIFGRLYKYLLIPIVITAAIVTLTPFTLPVLEEHVPGVAARAKHGPGMAVFGFTAFFLVFGGLYSIIKKTIRAPGVDRKQLLFVVVGASITFSLIITFNLILPAIFSIVRFIPLAPLFMVPFIGFTAYAIIRHKLLDVRVLAAESLTFVIAIVTFIEIIFSRDFPTALFRTSIFVLVFLFGILLIRSVRKEVEQRQRLEVLTKELEEANKKLKELDTARSEFISMASHQLRTPPSTMKWYLSSLLSGEIGAISASVRAEIEKMQLTNNSLIALIEDLLNVARIEHGTLEFNFQPVDIREIAKFITRQLAPLAELKKLKLIVKKPKTKIPSILADKEKLSQVINNLIDNAIKYTSEGKVEVELEASDKEVFVKVMDTGKGVSKEEGKGIFEKFGRGNNAIKYAVGLGLGLYVAKVIVEQHKGKIWVESEGDGQGSTFVVALPIAEKIEPFKKTIDLIPR